MLQQLVKLLTGSDCFLSVGAFAEIYCNTPQATTREIELNVLFTSVVVAVECLKVAIRKSLVGAELLEACNLRRRHAELPRRESSSRRRANRERCCDKHEDDFHMRAST